MESYKASKAPPKPKHLMIICSLINIDYIFNVLLAIGPSHDEVMRSFGNFWDRQFPYGGDFIWVDRMSEEAVAGCLLTHEVAIL